MGKIYQFGKGCVCPINALSSKFLEILDLGDEEFLIADTDAGIEHFGRGVEKGVDILLAEVAQRVVDTLPFGLLVDVDSAGHSVPGDNPDTFEVAVRNFLGSSA
jgi:hypothetical protein